MMWEVFRSDFPRSLLAFRAPERRAAVLRETSHDAATARGLAFLAFAVVDLKGMLEIAEFAGGLAMIAQRRAAGLDRLIQHRVNCIDQTFGVIGRLAPGNALALSGGNAFALSGFGRQRRGQSPRRQMRTKQRLADIDVAEPRDHALIEQRRLQAGLLVGAGARQHRRVEFVAERFGTEAAQERLPLQRMARNDLHVAEAARVVEDNGRARIVTD